MMIHSPEISSLIVADGATAAGEKTRVVLPSISSAPLASSVKEVDRSPTWRLIVSTRPDPVAAGRSTVNAVANVRLTTITLSVLNTT